MRLSDAIAMGRVLLKPVGGTTFDADGKGGCAIGMALKARGFDTRGLVFNPLAEYWDWTTGWPLGMMLPCGCHSEGYNSGNNVGMVIAHIFDFHVMGGAHPLWTLDQLIDWVRSIEPTEATPSPSAALVANDARTEVVEK
jgi:hypothetical protein